MLRYSVPADACHTINVATTFVRVYTVHHSTSASSVTTESFCRTTLRAAFRASCFRRSSSLRHKGSAPLLNRPQSRPPLPPLQRPPADPVVAMSNPLDTDAGSELFSSYEAELKLVQADLSQKMDQIPELTGEPRKSAVTHAERALEEADELV